MTSLSPVSPNARTHPDTANHQQMSWRQEYRPLAIFLLKGLRPEKFKERAEMRGALARLDISQLPDHLLQRVANGEHILSLIYTSRPHYPGTADTPVGFLHHSGCTAARISDIQGGRVRRYCPHHLQQAHFRPQSCTLRRLSPGRFEKRIAECSTL